MSKNYESTVNGFASQEAAKCMDNQQWTKYHAKGATGFAAEDANALADSWHGHKVDKVGLKNTLNGADRIVDRVQVQTKYAFSVRMVQMTILGWLIGKPFLINH